jgi:precorrin-2 dehydrogenase/sirohydrochlorin ferrochelatase
MSPAHHPERFPVLLDVSGRLVVVVGSSRSAVRTATRMASYGADVVVISPDISEQLLELEASGVLTTEPRGYVRGDLMRAFVAVCASGSPEIDAAVREEATTLGILVTVLDDADASTFTVPSVVQRGPLQIAISTGGIAPAVARRVRREIASVYGPEWGVYVALLGAVRARAIDRFGVGDDGLGPLFDSIAASDLLERVRAGEDPSADDVLEEHAIAMEPEAEGDDGQLEAGPGLTPDAAEEAL